MSGDKALDKSPDYIMEKFNRYCLDPRENESDWGLDSTNRNLLEKYLIKWVYGKNDKKSN